MVQTVNPAPPRISLTTYCIWEKRDEHTLLNSATEEHTLMFFTKKNCAEMGGAHAITRHSPIPLPSPRSNWAY